jgi:MFS family permease
MLFVLIALGLPVVGEFADRYGTRLGIAGPMTLTSLSLITILTLSTRIITYVGVAGIGLGVTWAGSIRSPIMQQFETYERGTGFELVRTVFILLSALGNVTTGYLAEHMG